MSRKLLRAPVALSIALLAVLLSGSLSCSKDGATAPIILTPLTVVPSLVSAEPATAVTLTIRGLPLPTTGLAAKFNAQALTIARLSDTTAVILVPSVPAGTGVIEVTAPGARGEVAFRVLATVPVANPTVYLDSAVTDFTSTAADFSSSDPALSAFWTDRMNTLRTQIAALTPAERANAAAVLRQAIARLDTTGTSAYAEPNALGDANAFGDCDDYESCAAKIPSVEVITTRVLGGAALIGIGVDLGAAPPPNPYTIVAGGLLAGVGMHVLLETLSQTLRYGTQAIFASFSSDAELRAAKLDTSLASRMASLTGAGTFISDSASKFIVYGRYASPSRATASSNRFAGYVIGALDFLSGLWNSARAKFPALPAFRAIPATPATTVVAPIPTKYLALGARTPSAVSGSAQTRADSSWYVRFSLPNIGNEHPFSFVVNYSGAGATVTAETFTAKLVPDTFPVAKVEILNSTGVLGVQVTRQIALVAVVKDSMDRVLTDRQVTWTSSQPDVASAVSSGLLTGIVTGIREGAVTIRAQAETKNATAVVVVGPVPVDTVILSPDTLPIGLGGTARFTVTLLDSLDNVLTGRVVTWTSTNGTIASVDATGLFTGHLPGITGITATSEGKTAQAAVRVIAAARALSSGGASAHHCAIATGGALFCWGSNSSGQLGDFTGNSRNVPVPSTAAADDAAQVSTGAEHSCARYANGTVQCWGLNDVGQLGNGTETPFEVPATVVSGGHNFAKLASGPNATCGITTAGAAYCWGVLSGGTTVVPTLVSGGHVFADISSGGIDGFCGLTTGGNILCWGQLGWETATTPYNSVAPRQVGSGRTYTKLAMTAKTQCGVSGAQIWCWGAQDAEAIGITAFPSTPVGANWTGVPFAVSGGAAFVDVMGGLRFTCGLTTTGSVWCWGPIVGVEQTVDGSVPLAGSMSGVHAQGDGAKFQDRAGTGYTALAASRSTVCGLRDGGIVWCWGSNSNGQAGQGTVPGGIRPTALPAPIEEPVIP